ncbi:MAG: putative dinucleotide-binding enzyme [Frankiales bacterium]|nr:putative dinucleotide-binding enzyme [Frankiales bacterium]
MPVHLKGRDLGPQRDRAQTGPLAGRPRPPSPQDFEEDPQRNVQDLPAGLFAGADEYTVVVDTGNYYPKQRGGRIQGIEDQSWRQQPAPA